MHAITMTLNRVIWEEFGIKKPPMNEDAQRGLGWDDALCDMIHTSSHPSLIYR